MDINATLAEIRLIVQARLDNEEDDRLAEAVHYLDEWLSNGGFLPAAWQKDIGSAFVNKRFLQKV